jgi:glutathione S-transferase/RNA polymerase-associated protein
VAQTLAESRAEATNNAGNLEAARQAVAAGLFKRQYRDHRLEWMMRSGGADIVLDGMKAGNIRFGTELA